jgi:hypothetical protein
MPSNPTSPLSRDEWSEHVAKWRTSEQTRIEYCQQHGLALNAFVYQINRHRDGQAKKLTLVPVKVGATTSCGEVVLRGSRGWSVTMAGDVSAAWLGDLLGRLS